MSSPKAPGVCENFFRKHPSYFLLHVCFIHPWRGPPTLKQSCGFEQLKFACVHQHWLLTKGSLVVCFFVAKQTLSFHSRRCLFLTTNMKKGGEPQLSTGWPVTQDYIPNAWTPGSWYSICTTVYKVSICPRENLLYKQHYLLSFS